MNPLFRNDRQGEFPPSYYAATAEIPPVRAPLDGDRQADVVIVGAGFCGLWAALRCAEAGLKPLVIEAHRAGFGASGRNGGQVGTAFNKGMDWIEARLGDDTARALWDIAEAGKESLRDFCASASVDCHYKPGVAHGAWREREVQDIHAEADYLAKTYGYSEIEVTSPQDFSAIVRSPIYKGGAIDWGAGHVHPLRYALALAEAAEGAGAEIVEMTTVTAVTPGDPVRVVTDRGTVTAKFAILAGNGYMPNIAPRIAARTMPINSFIAATEPLGDRAAQVLSKDIAVADARFVVNYFRLSDDKRLLFGGRENYSLGFPKDIGTRLKQRMVRLFPQIDGVGVDYIWGGTLGITMNRLPFVTRVGDNVLSAGGFSGHGVALSGMAGQVMAAAITGQAGRFDVMSRLPCPAFPGGAALRAPLLTLAMTWYSLRDRLGL